MSNRSPQSPGSSSVSATDAIRQVAKSLSEGADVQESVLLLIYIADALDREIRLAAERAQKFEEAKARQLEIDNDMSGFKDRPVEGPVCKCNEHWPCTCLRGNKLGALDDWSF